ncbi:MAG: cell division protein ZapA [Muribaculaceae bacterium]|nr:cell division protein ZapA [Muribaculaceae bacterium]
MEKKDTKQNIWIQLADVKPIAVSIPAGEEASFRKAEDLVNDLWNRWMKRFGENSTSHDVLARVAFQFARLFMDAYAQNKAVDDFLADFEKKLDDIVVKA